MIPGRTRQDKKYMRILNAVSRSIQIFTDLSPVLVLYILMSVQCYVIHKAAYNNLTVYIITFLITACVTSFVKGVLVGSLGYLLAAIGCLISGHPTMYAYHSAPTLIALLPIAISFGLEMSTNTIFFF